VRPRSHLKQDPMYRSLPEDEVHNEALVRAAVESTDRAAFLSRDTVFSKTLAAEAVAAAPVLRVVHSLSIAAVRCWMKITSGIYPTASYLHRIGRAPTSDCPHCSGGARETLGHFAGECPRFHDARTSAHNQSWSAISSVLSSMLPAWELCWETSMSACGLELSPASFRSGDAPHTTCVTAGSLTPDGVAVHRTLRKILILEFCRPAHGSSPSLQAAWTRKREKYLPLGQCLRKYTSAGWTFDVLLFVVNIHEFVHVAGLFPSLADRHPTTPPPTCLRAHACPSLMPL